MKNDQVVILVPFYPLYVPTPKEDYFAVCAEAANGQIVAVNQRGTVALLRELWGKRVHGQGRGRPWPEWISVIAGKAIYDFHNNYIGRGRLAIAMRRWMFNRCERVIVHSEFARLNYIAQGIRSDKLAVIAHPIDADYFATPGDPGRFRKQWNLGEEPFALCVGMRWHKNPWVMIDACQKAGIRLVMVGFKSVADIKDWPKEFLPEQKLLELDTKDVVLTGYLSTEALRDAYQACSVYLNSSEADGEVFCLAVYEAAAAGAPLCLPDYGTFDPFKDAALFHPNRDSVALSVNIQRVQKDAGLKASMITKAKVIAHHFSVDVIRERYKDLYRSAGFLDS